MLFRSLASLGVEEVPIQKHEEQSLVREKMSSVSERRAREGRLVEKLQPMAEPKSWRDYEVWIGIGMLVVVSVVVSLYLYLTKP